jgi:hypothetical protein
MKISCLGLTVFVAALGIISSVRAEDGHEYVVAANDGYGLEDCLAAGSECGRVVADAWCEANGHGHALAYGPRSSLDGRPTQISTADDPYLVRCGD